MKKSFPKGLFFALCYFFYTSIYLSRINLSMASPALLADGVLTEVELGFIGSAFSVIYAIGRLCNGVLGDRLAPWVMVSVGLLGTGIANMFIGVLPPYLLILGLWCINAFAQSMLWSALLRCITAIYGREEANRKATILVSSVSAGNIGSILLSSVLVSNFGVSAAFYVPGAVCVICGVTAMYILRQVPDTDRSSTVFVYAVCAGIHGQYLADFGFPTSLYCTEYGFFCQRRQRFLHLYRFGHRSGSVWICSRTVRLSADVPFVGCAERGVRFAGAAAKTVCIDRGIIKKRDPIGSLFT